MAHTVSRKTYAAVYVALLILLALTILAGQFELGLFNMVIALAIAGLKMLLIMLFFMHVRTSGRMIWIVAGAGLFWLGILFGLTMTDFLSRGWLPAGK